MIHKNLTNILLAVLGVFVFLTVYNASTNSNDTATVDNSSSSTSDSTSSAGNSSTRLAAYLAVALAKQAVVGAEDVVAGTDNQPTESTDTTTPAETTSESTSAVVGSDTSSSTNTNSIQPKPISSSNGKPQALYTVKEGDTYGCIAEKYYGSFEHFTDIMASNPSDQVGFGEKRLFVDAQLILPAVSASELKLPSSLCQ